MAELLSSQHHINIRIEDTIAGSREYIYLICPLLATLPQSWFNKLWEANNRKVKIFLMYGKSDAELSADEKSKLEKLHGASLYVNKNIHVNVCINEKEGVMTSLRLTAPGKSTNIDFGIYFKKTYAAEMHDKIVEESKNIRLGGVKMLLVDGKFEEASVVEERRKQEQAAMQEKAKQEAAQAIEAIKAEVGEVASNFSTQLLTGKKLTVKEKQNLILDLFSKLCPECSVKVEDAERLRVVGKSIVVFANKERIEVVFVRYESYSSKKDEVKKFLETQHPDLKVWCTYNRITMNLDKAEEIISVFPSVKSALQNFGLV